MARAPFGFAPWPVIPAAPDDEAAPVGLAPGQMPVDPRRDGSVQPTAEGKNLSRAVGVVAGNAAQGLLDAATAPKRALDGDLPIFDPATGHVSDEAMGAGAGIAGLAMTGSLPFKVPAGAIRSFGGASAKEADPLAALESALGGFSPSPPAKPAVRQVDPGAARWDLYHGSEAGPDFARFDPNAIKGAERNSEAGALFLTPDAPTANFYAGGGDGAGAAAGPRVYRTTVEPGKTRVFDIPELIERDPRFGDEARAAVLGERAGPPTARDIASADALRNGWRDDFLASREQSRAINLQLADMGLPAEPLPGATVGHGYLGAAIARAKAEGLDTAVIRGLAEHGGHDQVVALTPGRVRSFYAPDQLLYAGAPAAAGLAGAAALSPGDAQAAPSSSGASPMAAGARAFSFMPDFDAAFGRPRGEDAGSMSLADQFSLARGMQALAGRTPAQAAPASAEPPQSEPAPVAPFSFAGLAPRASAPPAAQSGFGPGSAGAGLPLPPQEPVATGATAPAIRPQARPAQSPAPASAADGTMASAPLPPARPPEFGSSAAPAAPLDIKPPAQAAVSSAAEPSTWDKVSGFLGNNSDMLIGIGTGLMSTPGIGRGLAAGVQNGVAMQQAAAVKGLAQAKQAVEMQKLAKEQQNVGANALYVKTKIPGIPDAVASSLGSNSSFMTELYKGLIPAQELFKQFTDQSGNIWNQNQRTGQATVALKAEEDKTQTPLTDPTARLRAGIRQDDKRSAWLDANGKVTYESGQPNTQVTVNNAVNPILKGLGDQFVEGAASARSAADQVRSISNAREQLDRDGGLITGFRANDRLALQKVGALLGVTDPNAIQNTESLRAALKPMVLESIKALGTNPSNNDLNFANGFSGGDINLDEGSIRRIMDLNERAARAKIERHNALADQMLSRQPDLGAVGPMLRIDMPAAYAPPAPAQSAPAAAPVQAAPTAPAKPRRVFDPATGAFR